MYYYAEIKIARKVTITTMSEATGRFGILQSILTPVVRYCLKYGVTVREISEALRRVFIDLCSEELRRQGERVTVSRLSVVTGIHRRDVMRLLAGPDDTAVHGLMARVITAWENDKRFCLRKGKPKVLSYDGKSPNFQDLAASVSTDVGPAAVLRELIRTGVVDEKNGELKLKSSVAKYSEWPERGLNLLSRDFASLGQAVQENLDNPQAPIRNLHIRTEFDNLFIEDIPTIRAWILRQGNIFHRKIREYLVRYDKDLNATSLKQAGGKIVVGSFSVSTSPQSEGSSKGQVQEPRMPHIKRQQP